MPLRTHLKGPGSGSMSRGDRDVFFETGTRNVAKTGPVQFMREVKAEADKVVWPTRPEATQMTLYVFLFVVVMALFLWITDKSLEWVIYGLILDMKH